MVKRMENPIKMHDLGGKPTIFGNIHLLKKNGCLFFWLNQTKGAPLICAAVESRRPNQPANHQGGRVFYGGKPRWESAAGWRDQWSPAVILAGSHSISVATGRMGPKSRGICAKDP